MNLASRGDLYNGFTPEASGIVTGGSGAATICRSLPGADAAARVRDRDPRSCAVGVRCRRGGLPGKPFTRQRVGRSVERLQGRRRERVRLVSARLLARTSSARQLERGTEPVLVVGPELRLPVSRDRAAAVREALLGGTLGVRR